MPSVFPAFATVRPRVTRRNVSEARLAEEVVAELLEELGGGLIEIVGPHGSGKSTAVSHLAAALSSNDRLIFLDEPTSAELDAGEGMVVVAADLPAGVRRSGVELKLAPWGGDELVEHLLATRPESCPSVMARLGDAGRRWWSPRLATIVLERFAAIGAATDPLFELCKHVRERLTPIEWEAACRFSLATLAWSGNELAGALLRLKTVGCPEEVRLLLRHETVQRPLAAESIVAALCAERTADLVSALTVELVTLAGARCRVQPAAQLTLQRALQSPERQAAHAMAASLMYAADATWRPMTRRWESWRLGNGHFAGAQWAGVDLQAADLSQIDLSDATLERASLQEAKLEKARLDGACLAEASLTCVSASGASFAGARLRRAKLAAADFTRADFAGADLTEAALMKAKLEGADLTDACLMRADLTAAVLTETALASVDLTGAVLRRANLANADLRTAVLDGANFERAKLDHAQLEDIRWPDARLVDASLRGAHLTGSWMPRADLRGANLSRTGLAEIEWEGADLRNANLKGATFHMGSSRSGLVGSPIACEGSKTGFYTDDFEDMHFKKPEEIRKANLCGADLRGANIDGLDFYLVDLRDAKLDPPQLAHVQRCGAILSQAVA